MPDYTKVNIAEVQDVAVASGFGHRWEARVVRSALGATTAGMTHFRLRPGLRSPFSHRHREAEEIYLILAGSGSLKLDDELIEVAALDAVRVPAEVARAFQAGPDGLEFIAVGAHHPGDGVPVEDPWVS